MHLGGHFGQRVRQSAVLAALRLAQYPVERLSLCFRGCAFVHKLEMRVDASFQREPAQQRFAKGMDRLNLETAGRFKHFGEQHPRAPQYVVDRRIAGQVFDGLTQLAVFGDRPFGQKRIDSVGHLCRCCAREGKTQNPVGRRPRKQQRENAVGQDLGLARARRCRDPDGTRRVGGAPLGCTGIGTFDDSVHSSPPLSTTDHS